MRPQRVPLLAGVVALAAWCGWVSGFPRSSTPAEVTWTLSLAVVIGVAALMWLGRRGAAFGWNVGMATEPWPRRSHGGGCAALRGVAPWLGVIVIATAWDALGIDTGPHEAHLTISALSQTYRPLNALLLLLWMLAGIGYAAARARAPCGTSRRDGSPGRDSDAEPRGGAGLCAAGSVPAGVHAATPALLLPSDRPL
ncbi:MAG TPA: hypothetical protein VK773_08330, partial [Acidimicrobiales bacterium]|nr:hypothetical protein [Acidimicrobiales bacterium]